VDATYQVLFPFTLQLENTDGRFLDIKVRPGGLPSTIGLIISLAGYVIVEMMRHRHRPGLAGSLLVAITGIYGLIAVTFLKTER